MIKIAVKGNYKKTEKKLKQIVNDDPFRKLEKYGKIGVDALSSATPVDSNLTSESWIYEIVRQSGSFSIVWSNTHVEDGVPIAIILQYGHGTGSGGFVQGRDYINPAMRPIFDQMANEMWREVTK